MNILVIGKYPPIQGGVSTDTYWTSQVFAELGHTVRVLTSAQEVEEQYRINLTEEDQPLLRGYRRQDSIRVHSTTIDTKHKYVPQGNPVLSKILSAGLEMIEKERPDFIWSYYLEPYGVAAYLLSSITGVPYTVRHAGTDFGRLFRTEQLNGLYRNVFRQATFLFSKETHHDELVDVGVDRLKLIEPISPRLPGDVFYSTPQLSDSRKLKVGVYGKVGPSKGTKELLDAMAILRDENYPVELRAHWGGRGVEKYVEHASKLGLESPLVTINGFVPQWRIPDFIRAQHTVVFLENNFHIVFHAPGVPIEVNSCGRILITTSEIMEKSRIAGVIQDGVNAEVVSASPLTPEDIVSALKRTHERLLAGETLLADAIFDASLYSARARSVLREHLERIEHALD